MYTVRAWGKRQKDKYKASLDEALLRLREYPEIGQLSDDLPPGYRGLRVEQHMIYYRIEGDSMQINRILHVRQDVRSALIE